MPPSVYELVFLFFPLRLCGYLSLSVFVILSSNKMKTFTQILTIILAAFIMSVAQKGALQESRKTNQVFFDFRIDRTNRVPRIPLATQRRVLSKVFPKYLTDDSKCSAPAEGVADDYLAAARRAGQIVPTLVDMTTGSFTTALQQETAYVISVNECHASHADNFGTKRVAIFSGQKLVANVDADFKTTILRRTDLDNDGIDELLMLGGDMNQGIVIETAALVNFQSGRLKVIQDFGQVSEDSCASGFPDSGVTAAVISVGTAEPGKMPRLRVVNYASNCNRIKRWRKADHRL